ncbi:MAG TPA: SRPBCC family protein [Candidatus Angelobacter sp.]|nr:SRPBCC family protein [Candidatus Angelobacter sp.]
MLIIIMVALPVLIALFLILAATRPDTFRVQRAANIRASSERIFPLISDFHNWGSWSPWEKLDPAMKRTFDGAASGKGSVYAWEGSKAGAGRMEIMSAAPSSKIVIKLDFIKPFEAHNTVEFNLEGEGESTKVTWDMEGRSPYMMKVMGIFFNMDNRIGKDFEAGLASMKAVAEK